MVAELYPHYIGHPHGIDIHEDEPGYNKSFEAGNTVTVEPGIYLPLEMNSIPEKWRGIAVRIEDDVLITANGYENLSIYSPSKADDIEKMMKVNPAFVAPLK